MSARLKLNPRQILFCKHLTAGLSPDDACRAAGYGTLNLKQRTTALMQNALVRAHLATLQPPAPNPAPPADEPQEISNALQPTQPSEPSPVTDTPTESIEAADTARSEDPTGAITRIEALRVLREVAQDPEESGSARVRAVEVAARLLHWDPANNDSQPTLADTLTTLLTEIRARR